MSFFVQFDELKLLKGHKYDYPSLYVLAMDILPIQASSVPCERIFSSAKETMTPRRNRIRPKLMEALQILKSAIKLADLDFTAGSDRESELKHLEFLMEEEVIIPEDIDRYTSSLEQRHEAEWAFVDSDEESVQLDLDEDFGSDGGSEDFSFSM
jgi:hypothetical protein